MTGLTDVRDRTLTMLRVSWAGDGYRWERA